MGSVNTSRSTGIGSAILPTPHPVPPGGGYTQFPPGLGGYNPFGMPYFGRPPMMMGQPLHPHPMQQHPSLSNQQVSDKALVLLVINSACIIVYLLYLITLFYNSHTHIPHLPTSVQYRVIITIHQLIEPTCILL